VHRKAPQQLNGGKGAGREPSAGTLQLPPVGALDISASTVLVTTAPAGAVAKDAPPTSAAAGAVAKAGQRRSSDSSGSSAQSWEMVAGENSSGGLLSPV
jgi:hypothetical protein